jgi:3-keto-L-gulonate-6-phosphate decarboxylase
MKAKSQITIESLCVHYKLEFSFFNSLNELGLIQIDIINNDASIAAKNLSALDKMIRLHKDLDLNIEGIEVVLNLIDKVNTLQTELSIARNKLKLYEK